MLRFVCSIPDLENSGRYLAHVYRRNGEPVYGIRQTEGADFLVYAYFDPALTPQSIAVLYAADIVESKEIVISEGPEPKVADEAPVMEWVMPPVDFITAADRWNWNVEPELVIRRA